MPADDIADHRPLSADQLRAIKGPDTAQAEQHGELRATATTDLQIFPMPSDEHAGGERLCTRTERHARRELRHASPKQRARIVASRPLPDAIVELKAGAPSTPVWRGEPALDGEGVMAHRSTNGVRPLVRQARVRLRVVAPLHILILSSPVRRRATTPPPAGHALPLGPQVHGAQPPRLLRPMQTSRTAGDIDGDPCPVTRM